MRETDSTRRQYLQALGSTTLAGLAGCLDDGSGDEPTETSMDDSMTATDDSMSGTDDDMSATAFAVTVENVSSGDTLQTMDGGVAVPLSPGVYAVHSGMAHLFTPGEAASDGLEALAEDGAPGGLAEEVADTEGVLSSGAFTTLEGGDGAGPIGPGESYRFEVEASADADPALSLATMFVQSNDLFYAPAPGGAPLFEDGEPVSGDVTGSFALWNAGTEGNQPPGEGADQAPRQSGPDTGAEEVANVRRIGEVDDGHEYPAVEDVLRVTVGTM